MVDVLPKMGLPKILNYMTDQSYNSIVIYMGAQVIGGCTIKCHRYSNMIELTLMAIKEEYHLFGFGAKVVGYLIKYARDAKFY